VPGVGEAFMDVSRRAKSDRDFVQRVINLCFADPRRSDPELMDAATALVAYRRLHMPKQDAAFLQAARSVLRAGLRPRQFKNTMKSLPQPVLLIHGDQDRLVPITAARIAAAANPQWDTEFLSDVGHTPQLENPDEVIRAVERWLDRHELGATGAGNMTAPSEETR
jgi:pimeloyl-ACP methyl ester carboxylesterase